VNGSAQILLFPSVEHYESIKLTAKDRCVVQLNKQKSRETVELEKVQRIIRS
jgi:hypothetical protein